MTAGPAADASDESFQSHVLRGRGRTGLTQRELAVLLGVHVRSVQAWEAGVSYPTADSLKALLVGYLKAGGFEAGREAAQAELLWISAVRESSRLLPDFSQAWFARQLLEIQGAGGRASEPGVPPGDGPLP